MLPDQWQLYKTVRCAALAEAPYAYSTTLKDALQRSDEGELYAVWVARALIDYGRLVTIKRRSKDQGWDI